MTYRERRQARAERLRAWAEKRDAKAAAAQQRVHQIADRIPLGQPILVGHHSERHARRDQARIESGMTAAVESWRMADRMRERADNIEHAAERAIYDDDPDAIPRLAEKIAMLEARRARIKTINAALRRGDSLDALQLTAGEVRDLEYAARFSGTRGYPAYALRNLGGTLRKARERLAALQSRQDQGTATC